MGTVSYRDTIKAQGRSSRRPKEADELLLFKIADDPEESDARSYEDWEFDHGASKRFYVGGFRWFMRNTKLNASTLAVKYKAEVPEALRDRTDWTSMPDPKNAWSQIARIQFSAASNQKPMFFQKAAMVLMACELAVEEMLKGNIDTGEIKKPEDIYTTMSVVPACWNINDFTEEFLEKLGKSSQGVSTLKQSTGLSSKALEQVASGYTVTWQTANKIKSTLEEQYHQDVTVGRVRSKPGRKRLGKKAASEYESVDLG